MWQNDAILAVLIYWCFTYQKIKCLDDKVCLEIIRAWQIRVNEECPLLKDKILECAQ